LNTGDTITFKFKLSSSNTSNFTTSIDAGSLSINSLSVSTGYLSTTCTYFNSASISQSVVLESGSTSTITFTQGLSNFFGGDYIFNPSPVTGSQNSLYPSYGDVEYPLSIKPQDIIITYLSDNTYIESRILGSSYSGSYLQVQLDTLLSNTYIANIESGSYKRFLILSRQDDETNTFLTFKKREGSTSYGFIIPQNIAPDVLANIDTITKEVNQKLLSDQSSVTINTF
jgi:cold shock CspA family protein